MQHYPLSTCTQSHADACFASCVMRGGDIIVGTRVHTQHTAIHGAPGFAISEYDGYGNHSYFNVSLGRRHVNTTTVTTAGAVASSSSSSPPPPPSSNDVNAMCGVSNPTGGRLCLGLISSNNDGLHSSGCKYGQVHKHAHRSLSVLARIQHAVQHPYCAASIPAPI